MRLSDIKKSKGYNAFIASLLAIALGLIFGLIVMLIANPLEAFPGFATVLFGGVTDFAKVLYFATPILMTGLAVGFAFKMGMFNIGASGQYTMGMFFAMYVGFMFPMNNAFHWILCILAGMVGGMLWGAIPGIFKAYFNVNEVITSIMFNYIGMYFVDMSIQSNGRMYVPDMARTAYLPQSAQIPSLGIPNSNLNLSIIFAIIIAIILYVVLNKTTFGYELKATGFNKHASKYAGMNGKRNIILSMVIAGGLAGLGGAFAIGIIFSATFISHLQRGGTAVSGLYGFKPEIIDIVIAVIIYFSAFAILMRETFAKILSNKRKKKITIESQAKNIGQTTNEKEEK